MTSLQFLSQLIEHYGLYAVFFLVMIEGDITLLLAGVLAHSAFFGDSNVARFLLLSAVSCFLWVLVLSGLGYFISSAVMGLMGDFRRLGNLLLLIVVVGLLAVYLVKRYWVSKKVQEVEPDKLHRIEHAAIE